MLDERQVRHQKLSALAARGYPPYPQDPQRTVVCGEALASFEVWSAEKRPLTLDGRIITIRVHGKMLFADLMDASGKIQLAFKQDKIGDRSFVDVRDLMDPGDIIEVTGVLFLTKRGEKSLEVHAWRPLAKALLPLPEKWHGLKDVEARYREREMDLVSNPEVRGLFVTRSQIVTAMRRFLDDQGFMEVETPILHPVVGGANARPFVTHHQALGADFYLSIAPELYLKRLIVGGFEKVYEVARCFRNEGIDPIHNPEFTQIELYWAYAKKESFFSFMETFVATALDQAFGTLCVKSSDGAVLDFTPPWSRQTFTELVKDATGIDVDALATAEEVERASEKKGLAIDYRRCIGRAEALDELFKKTARLAIRGPIWALDYPVEMKPLANHKPDDPTKAAVAQMIVCGAEVINAFYHELNNPLEQRERFLEQQRMAEAGSEEAQRLDESYLRAMEHGMPPTCGMGIGIDRFVSLVTGVHQLKEVILFPTLRPLVEQDKGEQP